MKTCSTCFQHFIEDNCPHCDSQHKSSMIGGIALGALLGVGLTACQDTKALYGVEYVPYDLDEDGYEDFEDCDDGDPYTFPGAAIEDSETACMTDFDGDGYGDNNPAVGVEAGTDCDDSDPTINPQNGNCTE